jgi:hypothetical protein
MANITDRISKEQFETAYNHHLPSEWIKYAYEHFSTTTEKTNFTVKKIVVGVLSTLFAVGFLSTVIGLSKSVVAFTVILYSIVLGGLVLYLFSAVILNNLRIRKIRKELGITKDEYNALVSVYY